MISKAAGIEIPTAFFISCLSQNHKFAIRSKFAMNTLIESWKQEENHPFSGWDFSYLDGRMHEEQTP